MGITCMLVCMRSTCGWYEFDWWICWIQKGGEPPPPNRPWAICLSVWYEDWSALSTIPVSDTERRHKRDVGRAERWGFITKKVHQQMWDLSLTCGVQRSNMSKTFIGAEKFHPIIHRQMRFIVHFVGTWTYLCLNSKHIYFLVRNVQYCPPGSQTGRKETLFDYFESCDNLYKANFLFLN